MAGQAFDKHAGRTSDTVREGNQPSESVLAEVHKTPENEQKAIIAESGGRGKDVPASFKSPDGTDATIVKATQKGTEVNKDVEYKPEEVVKGEIRVSSTLGNDTQWAVTLPEVGRKESIQTTEVTKEAVPSDNMTTWGGSASDHAGRKAGDEPEARQRDDDELVDADMAAQGERVDLSHEEAGRSRANLDNASESDKDQQMGNVKRKRH